MQTGLDYLPMVIRQIQFHGLRASAVHRWLGMARRELAQRRLERMAPLPVGAPRTYVKSWKAMQLCAERELSSLKAAIAVVEAFCRDGRRDRLQRALLLHEAARQSFSEYCKRRLEILVDPKYLAA